ncbi:MAG: hypothetical protein KDB53_15520, partial [Planctomycetes bacterium]|nr:hypothetical protein [Planctomycetota bacterium]
LFYLIKETFGLDKVAKERMFVVLILTFFSFLFWAFFEQAGSSISVFTDRNVDRVQVERTLTAGDVGTTIEFRVPLDTTEEDLKKLPPLTQAQLGWPAPVALRPVIADAILRDVNDENKAKAEKMKEVQEIADSAREAELFTISGLTALRSMAAKQDALESDKKISWSVTAAMVGMEIGESETPASIFQAANPGFILIFGLIFTWLWAFMAARGKEPSTPFKFALGLLQLGLGFVALWMGANSADDRGMVGVSWLLLGYLLHTTGELCLSPVGLSMVTKLSPARLVSTVMGAWFLATAMSNLLASIIAQFTGIESSEGENTILPAPTETVNVYGDVYNKIAIASIVSAVICFLLVPKLKVWMHPEVDTE